MYLGVYFHFKRDVDLARAFYYHIFAVILAYFS